MNTISGSILFQKAKSMSDINRKDHLDHTILYDVVSLGYFDIVKYLVDRGATINTVNGFNHYTPLVQAIIIERLDIIKYLVDNGADVNYDNSFGTIPIMVAVNTNNLDIFKYLISAGANLDIRKYGGDSLLFQAIICDKYEIAKYIIENNISSASINDNYNQTPIDIAYIKSIQNDDRYLKCFIENRNRLDKVFDFDSPFLNKMRVLGDENIIKIFSHN